MSGDSKLIVKFLQHLQLMETVLYTLDHKTEHSLQLMKEAVF